MKTLVLCVDRDDDVGTKTPVKGPLIGRDENLVAATKLGLADPEDPEEARLPGRARARGVQRPVPLQSGPGARDRRARDWGVSPRDFPAVLLGERGRREVRGVVPGPPGEVRRPRLLPDLRHCR